MGSKAKCAPKKDIKTPKGKIADKKKVKKY